MLNFFITVFVEFGKRPPYKLGKRVQCIVPPTSYLDHLFLIMLICLHFPLVFLLICKVYIVCRKPSLQHQLMAMLGNLLQNVKLYVGQSRHIVIVLTAVGDEF